MKRGLILAGAALLAAGCAAVAQEPVLPEPASAEPASAEPASAEPATAAGASVSYAADIVPLLESQCATCHLTGEEAGGMALVGDMAIASLVGQPAEEAPGLMRVVAGDPDRSYLVMKLEGTHIANGGAGAQMPFGAPPLTAAEIATVRAWIAQGARP
ncbi:MULTISPECIES: hypothetical protein [Novosphingobium]|uniref:hypothetical protein n=1 Tax=Novosphingobium TaxID=165696 RepID=UPI000D6DD800|nr:MULTISPECIES: hypothetical protein [Novosphingobium]